MVGLFFITFILSAVWFTFAYVPSHYAKPDVIITHGVLMVKYTYVEYGNTYGLVTIRALSENQTAWLNETGLYYKYPLLTVDITVTLDFQYMNSSSISAFAQSKVSDTVTVTRTYLCDGYNPNSFMRSWISGCELQTITFMIGA